MLCQKSHYDVSVIIMIIYDQKVAAVPFEDCANRFNLIFRLLCNFVIKLISYQDDMNH
jgi:hypothetical protein